MVVFLVACADDVEPPVSTPNTAPVPTAAAVTFTTDDRVTLQESSISWTTYQYVLDPQYGILRGSYDGISTAQQSFQTWILENRYLRVTLLPEFGGRMLSIVYKPTGHEELYQNPVGVPYQIGTGVFYYDWLMVYGGIFPTFPEPEHGKTWLLPWDFHIVNESDQEVTVAMSMKDEIDNPAAPSQYNLGATGLEVVYEVTLTAGRAAVDTRIQITNPGENAVAYEYWTNATLAPGSDPAAPRATGDAEIIAPIQSITIPRYWQAIASQETAVGYADVYEFKNLRRFGNWPDMGIAYAYPDMGGQNFWGVINHDNEEGIFRIADNSTTPGLKLWTWGYPHSSGVDPMASADESRPYIELWAGVTREFWQRTTLPATAQLQIVETYGPSIGLVNVTHANEAFLVNLEHDGAANVDCQLFGMYPEQTVTVSMLLDNEEVHAGAVLLDPLHAADCSAELPDWAAGSILNLEIRGPVGELLFRGDLVLQGDR